MFRKKNTGFITLMIAVMLSIGSSILAENSLKVTTCTGSSQDDILDCNTELSRKPTMEEFIEETVLSKLGDYLDDNETAEMLVTYITEMEKVETDSLKKRTFGGKIECEPIEECLKESEKRLLALQAQYPESRHISEGLARIYSELYWQTGEKAYAEKSFDAFFHAEKMGIKHRGKIMNLRSHYVSYIFDITDGINKDKLDEYFTFVLENFPKDFITNLHAAQYFASIKDTRAEPLFKKAMELEPDGPFDSGIHYSEYLLDNKRYKEALDVLNKIDDKNDPYPKVNFLKGFAFEKLGKYSKARKEYNKYRKAIKEDPPLEMFVRPDSKFKIPNSKLQRGIQFESSGEAVSLLVQRTTPCADTDWVCKAYWYGVWTVDGEARGGTVGMHRAVAWSIRTRVFSGYGAISCPITYICFNYASNYPYSKVQGNVNRLNKRYWWVIETGGYAGLKRYSTPTDIAIKAWKQVYKGKVPDPIVGTGKCPVGYRISGGVCDGVCSEGTLWGSWGSHQSGVEFRAGKLEFYIKVWEHCYEFVPMSTPSGKFCGKDCFVSKGAICPVETVIEDACWNQGLGFYDYEGPSYGNIFWRFNL